MQECSHRQLASRSLRVDPVANQIRISNRVPEQELVRCQRLDSKLTQRGDRKVPNIVGDNGTRMVRHGCRQTCRSLEWLVMNSTRCPYPLIAASSKAASIAVNLRVAWASEYPILMRVDLSSRKMSDDHLGA